VATHDYVIANGTGAAVRSDLNGALAAIVSNNSNASEPATMYAYQWWADTTTGLLKIRNAANSAWVTIGTLASANLGLLPLAGGTMTGVLAVTAGTAALPGIAVSGDTNTGIYSPGADQVAISTGGTGRLFVQSDGDVCIGQSTGDSQLVVKGSTAARTVSQFIANDTSTTTLAVWERSDGAVSSRLIYDGGGLIKFGTSTSHALLFDTNNQTRMTILSGGNVGIGTTSPSQSLHVVSSVQQATFEGATQGNIVIQKVGTAGIGLYSNAAGTLSFYDYNATTDRMKLDSSGRLLVGTSNVTGVQHSAASGTFDVDPQSQINTLSNPCALLLRTDFPSNESGSLLALAKSRGSSVNSNTIVANGDTLGEIGFFGADGTDIRSMAASIQCRVDDTPGANDMPGRLVFSTTADGAASPTERMRINSAGEITMGSGSINSLKALTLTTGQIGTSSGTLTVGTANNNTNGRYVEFQASGGGVIGSITQSSASAVAYNTSSDYRLKENVTAVTDGIARIQQLKPSRFNFIADPDKTVDGFIAHEVQNVVPEAIAGEKDAVDDEGSPVYQGIDQSKLVPLLTAALQEAIAKIESLETRLSALEAA